MAKFNAVRWLMLALIGAGIAFGMACDNDDSTGARADETATSEAPASETVAAADPIVPIVLADGWVRVEGMRGDRYCEVLLATVVDARLNAAVWNTYGLNDCPPDAWGALDADAIKTERRALAALLNGPRYWLMDAIERQVRTDRQETAFGELDMFLAATVDLGPIPPDLAPYTERRVARGALFEFSEGSEVYELTDPDGRVFVMQSYSVQNAGDLTEADLPALGSRITVPPGWTYAPRTLDATLRVLGPGPEAIVIQDDLANTYSLVEPN